MLTKTLFTVALLFGLSILPLMLLGFYSLGGISMIISFVALAVLLLTLIWEE